MKRVMASRKPMAWTEVARAGPDMSRAGPGSHRSIFWATGRV